MDTLLLMLPVLIALHIVVALFAPLLVRALGARAFLVAGLPLALSAAWALFNAPAVVAGRPLTASVAWVPALNVTLDFRLDALALAMVILVSGVGAVIFCYSAWYFHADERALGRLVAMLLLFAAAMLGVVTTDNLFALYVFWELTSLTSFLLIGHGDQKEGSRRAAIQALVITVGTGLLMLIGFILLGQAGGSYTISELVADPPLEDPLLPLALVLILVGAFAKSAQAPLHFWLPGAMVAPTPVSGYLHAAAMVKGGVYLIARFAPGFADVDPWRGLVLAVGLATMVIGGWRALRQDDLKLLLAYGTVSQLGFLTLLAGTGTHTAAVAAIAVLLAHGLFKSTLFLTVGVIDHQTGTRSIAKLSGLGRRMPVLAGAAGFAAASMAGVPPLIGFVGKEGALEVFMPGGELGAGAATGMLVGVVGASILTFAYSARFVWGAFADKAGVSERVVRTPAALFVAPPVLLSGAGLLLGVMPFLVDPIAQSYAAPLSGDGHPYHLALWHGLTPALALSVLVIAVGAALFWQRAAVARAQNALPRAPEAELGYHVFIHGVYAAALTVTQRLQSGSLPVYLGTILATMLALPGLRLVWVLATGGVDIPTPESGLRLWDNPLEAVAAVVIVVTAVATVRERRRFPALIILAALGFGLCGLYVLHGAPDLALTLILVETLTTIILVFVLRRLPATFEVARGRWANIGVAAICTASGAFISVMLWLSGHARTHDPISTGYVERASEAGGSNLVNLILADFRALDTFGEIVVLATAAVAVSSLVLVNRRRTVDEPAPDQEELGTEEAKGGSA